MAVPVSAVVIGALLRLISAASISDSVQEQLWTREPTDTREVCFNAYDCRASECCIRRIKDGNDSRPIFDRNGSCIGVDVIRNTAIYTVNVITRQLACVGAAATGRVEDATLEKLVDGQELLGVCRSGALTRNGAEDTETNELELFQEVVAPKATITLEQIKDIIHGPELFVAIELEAVAEETEPAQENFKSTITKLRTEVNSAEYTVRHVLNELERLN